MSSDFEAFQLKIINMSSPLSPIENTPPATPTASPLLPIDIKEIGIFLIILILWIAHVEPPEVIVMVTSSTSKKTAKIAQNHNKLVARAGGEIAVGLSFLDSNHSTTTFPIHLSSYRLS